MIGCPAPDRLLAFASGVLSDDQSAALEEHIDSCADCRAALSSAARGDTPPRFGRYRIDTVLGSGGMGIVYRAWDPQLARSVAIKVVKRAADDATGRARLVREAQSLARLSHPNVCHVYDVGTEGDEVWVAMELIDGVSLRDWARVRREGILDVLLGAAEGIAAAHAAGLVHRDIKPENVLVTRDGRAIVTDFGLARGGEYIDPSASTLHTDPHLTATGAIAGTPAYLAPEQLTGDPIDDRVDQFAWGVMAWELVAGSRPFPIIFALRVDAVRAGLTPPPTMDRRVAAVLARAMQVAASDRFASMRELIDELRAPAPRGRARARRAPLLVGLAALVLGGAGVTLWETGRRPPQVTQTATAPSPNSNSSPSPSLSPTANPTPSPTPTPGPSPGPSPSPSPGPSPGPSPTPTPTPSSSPNPSPSSHHAAPRPAVAIRTAPSDAGIPAIPVDHIAADPNPPIAAAAPFVRPLRRDAALASLLSNCQIPSDVAHPDPAVRGPIVDWGKVAKIGLERGDFGGDPVAEQIVTIAGHRGTYRIDADLNAIGTIEPTVGDLIALCADREPTNPYHFPGGATLPVLTALPLHGEPRLAELAKLHAIEIRDIDLAAQGAGGRITLAGDRTYFVRTRSKGKDGDLFQMDRWWLEVAAGMAGADQIASGQPFWVVVERPELRSAPDGGKPELVLHAVTLVPELFP